MEYYIYINIDTNKLEGCGTCIDNNYIDYKISEQFFNEFKTLNLIEQNINYVWDGEKIIPNPNYETDKQAQIRAEKDSMTLTPSDVERALLAAKGWDFEDLKQYLKNEHGYTDLQIKAIGVELRANDFFRGAVLKGTNIRIVDTIGTLLGYDSDDMDYLFEHKELPIKED